MTKLSSATVTMSRTRTVEVQKCHFVYRLVTNVVLPTMTIDNYDAWYVSVESCDYEEIPVYCLPSEEYK